MSTAAGGTGGSFVLSESTKLRIASMTLFYIAQGLPIGLFLTAITAWLAVNGMSAGDVAAIVAMTYLPWSFKFVGAAAMDRYTYLPMGRRRPWLIGSQAVMVLGLALAALLAPTPDDASLLAWLGFAIFCGGAMQDVAVDGLAVDVLPDAEQGTASAFMFGGQALGIAGGGAMGGYVLDSYGSTAAFLSFVPLNAAFLLLAVVLRERPGEKLLPWTSGEASAVARENHGIGWLQILAVTVRAMLKRDSVVLLVASALGRAVGGAFLAFWPVFATSEAGYGTSSYSSMIAIVGLVSAVGCMAMGTVMVSRMGPKRSSILSYLGYCIIALVYLVDPDTAAIGQVFVLLSLLWNVTDTLTSICTNPLRMRLSDKRVAATQFTIYNSLSNLPVPLGASLFAWAMGAGGQALLMTILIAMTLASCAVFALLRIGKREDHEVELVPAVD